MSTNRVYKVPEVAEKLRVSTKTVYGLIRDKQLECLWVRGQIRITQEQLDDFMQGGSSS